MPACVVLRDPLEGIAWYTTASRAAVPPVVARRAAAVVLVTKERVWVMTAS
jgi:hypothetical protein